MKDIVVRDKMLKFKWDETIVPFEVERNESYKESILFYVFRAHFLSNVKKEVPDLTKKEENELVEMYIQKGESNGNASTQS